MIGTDKHAEKEDDQFPIIEALAMKVEIFPIIFTFKDFSSCSITSERCLISHQ